MHRLVCDPALCRFLYASNRTVMQKLHTLACVSHYLGYLDNPAKRRYPFGLPSFERG